MPKLALVEGRQWLWRKPSGDKIQFSDGTHYDSQHRSGASSLMLLGAGLAGIGLSQWKRRKAGQA